MARIEAGNRSELEELMRSIGSVMLTTTGADGHFHARPMMIEHEHSSLEGLWFATLLDSQKVRDVAFDPHCAVSFTTTGRTPTWVSMSGHATIVRDRPLIRETWNPAWNEWCPEGPEAHEVVLLRFTPEHVEYVHPTTGRFEVLVSVVRELVTPRRREEPTKRELDLPR